MEAAHEKISPMKPDPAARAPLVIAVDGPAASGKGTLARRLAAHYGLPHLDTGLLYRGVAAALLAKGLALDDVIAAEAAARNLDLAKLDDEALRGRDMGEAASVVAAYPEVRAALLRRQRGFASGAKGAVLDGRDIGTVICPDAAVKLYVTATPEVRAARRLKELAARGEPAEFEQILRDIRRRDARDSGRADAPLRLADDAVALDTSALTIDEAFAAATRIASRRLRD
jgi:cytidylate kinase